MTEILVASGESLDDRFKIFRDTRKESQPFKVDFVGIKIIDEGGGYRQVLSDIIDELIQPDPRLRMGEDEVLICPSPLGVGTMTINEKCNDTD